jgi:hypothetical protein
MQFGQGKRKGAKYWLGAKTPREFGRRLACCMAVLVIILQLTRVWLKHQIKLKQAEQEAWLSGKTKVQFENHTCHMRDHPAVDGCSPTKCARVVIDKFITEDECAQIISLGMPP